MKHPALARLWARLDTPSLLADAIETALHTISVVALYLILALVISIPAARSQAPAPPGGPQVPAPCPPQPPPLSEHR
jgi:hypothetical protein